MKGGLARPLSGRELLHIVKTLEPRAGCHLFRKTKGAEVAQEHSKSLSAFADVGGTLDLEREETAHNYV